MRVDAAQIAPAQRQPQPVEEIKDLDRHLAPVLDTVAKRRRAEPAIRSLSAQFADDRDHFKRGGAGKEMVMRDLVNAGASRVFDAMGDLPRLMAEAA